MAHSFKNLKIVRERNWDVFCESICLCKFNSSPAKNERKRTINIAFSSWHVLLKNRVSDFWHLHLFICDNKIKSEGANHQHFLWKNDDNSKTEKENKNRRHGFEKNSLTISWPNFSKIGSGAADLELKTYAWLSKIFVPRNQEKYIFCGILTATGL